MERKKTFYTTMLTHYLLVYAVLHLLAIVMILGFERGWFGFVYYLAFWFHLPFMLIGGGLSFLGKKTQHPLAWLCSLVCFVLSNGWWIYAYIAFTPSPFYLALSLTTLVPIVATIQLLRLRKASRMSQKSI